MRKILNSFVFPAGLMVMILLAASITNAQEVAEFVGTTATQADGGAGVLVFNRMCHADHPGTRMCTTVEVALTVNPPSAFPPAWVRPTFFSHCDPTLPVADVTGKIYPNVDDSACIGWRNATADFSGTTVVNEGHFMSVSCATARFVACCRPPGPKEK